MNPSRVFPVRSYARVVLGLCGAAALALSAQGYTLFCGNFSSHRATIFLNPNCRDASAGSPDAQEAEILGAINTWNTTAEANFQFQYGGRTTRARVSAGDGRDDIFWGDRADGAAIAITYCDGSDVEHGADVENLDAQQFSNSCGPGFDIQTVDLHELGHVLGLGHTTAPGAVMRAAYEGCRRALGDDDKAGIQFIYGSTARPPHVTSVEPTFGYVRGGDFVKINGTDFRGDATVRFASVNVPVASRLGGTQITVRAPAWWISGQIVDVTVSQSTGSSVLPGAYTYIENPVEVTMSGSPKIGSTVDFTVYGPPFQRAALAAGIPGSSTVRGMTFCWQRQRVIVLGTFHTLYLPAIGQTDPIPFRLAGGAFRTFNVQGVVTTMGGLAQTNCLSVTVFP